MLAVGRGCGVAGRSVMPGRTRRSLLMGAAVVADGGRSVATGADGSVSGREHRERSEARRWPLDACWLHAVFGVQVWDGDCEMTVGLVGWLV